MTGREKWGRFLAGDDSIPLVAPLCDKWSVGDIPYAWKGPGPEPFPPGANNHQLCGQLMMAQTFGWEPLFLAAIDFQPKDKRLAVKVSIHESKTMFTIHTPEGDLQRIVEDNGATHRCLKEYLESESDYQKMLWHTLHTQDFDREDALAQGRKIRRAVGDAGMLGTWVDLCVLMTDIQALFFHCMDFPEAFEALCMARRERQRKQLALYREAGFDYLFYVVPGTEWVSPSFFRAWMQEEIKANMAWWKSQGGFTVWHTCGHAKAFLEQGIYNEMMPDIFETLSEPPVGNIPSLEWARQRLDERIVTKGNLSLELLLNGSESDVRQAVRRVKQQTAGYRHIMALSDNILDGTPSRNLRAFVEESRR